MCSQELSVLNWINNPLASFKLPLKVIYSVFVFKKSLTCRTHIFEDYNKTNSFLWNTKKTDRNSANVHNSAIEDNIKNVGNGGNKWYHPTLTIPSFAIEKNWT